MKKETLVKRTSKEESSMETGEDVRAASRELALRVDSEIMALGKEILNNEEIKEVKESVGLTAEGDGIFSMHIYDEQRAIAKAQHQLDLKDLEGIVKDIEILSSAFRFVMPASVLMLKESLKQLVE